MTKTVSKADAKYFKKVFISEMMARLLSAYDTDGMTVAEYYNNIRLPDLTNQEFSWLKDMASSVENV
ncbi:MAG: hypothetical protein LBU85_08800 [Treponema sp.]|nr:hypothetical protein [Treponema sp.]